MEVTLVKVIRWWLRSYRVDGNFISITYMQKTCDVAEKAILAKKKFAEKVRKSR